MVYAYLMAEIKLWRLHVFVFNLSFCWETQPVIQGYVCLADLVYKSYLNGSCRPQASGKRYCNTGAFLWILWNV